MERPESPVTAPAAASMGPIAVGERFDALDAARGWALLGIFLVNVLLMGWPLGALIRASEGEGGDWVGGLAYQVTSVFAISRSFPLFSLLFGIGLAVQMERSGGAFGARAMRRLALLAVFGVAHALLLWFGDILFVYALCGIALMLLFLRRSVRTLCWAAAASFALGALLLVVMTIVAELGAEDPAVYVDPIVLGERPVAELVERLSEGEVSDPADPFWMAVESQAFRGGPYTQAITMRALLWVVSLVTFFTLGGTGLIAFAMMLLGAALHRAGALRDPLSPWPRRMVKIGATALVLSVVLQVGITEFSGTSAAVALQIAQTLIGSAVSAGYLGLVVLLVRRPAVYPRFRAGLCAAGRMALSNYLLQSCIGAAIFQHWGAAQFGRWSFAAGSALAILLWLLQLQTSRWWLARFRFGPSEWLWRSVTYAKLQPLRVELGRR